MNNIKLGTAIFLALVTGLFLPAIVSGWISINNERSEQIENLNSYRTHTLEVLALGMTQPVWTEEEVLGRPLLDSIMQDNRVIGVSVWIEDDIFLQQEKEVRRRGESQTIKKDIIYDGEIIGRILLEIDMSHLQIKLQEQRTQLIIKTIIQFGISFAIILLFMNYRFVGRIKYLVKQTQSIHSGNLNIHIDDPIEDEIGHLSYEFENMTQRLNTALVDVTASEAKYRTIFENAAEGIFQKVPQGKLLNINPSFIQIFGYTSEADAINTLTDFSKFGFLTATHADEIEQILALSGRVDDFVSQIMRKDGGIAWISLSCRVIESEGELLHEGTILDITARVEKQAAEDKTRSAEMASEAKSEFLANMSHEIRTPMNAILGMSHLVMKTDLSTKQHDYLKRIDNAAKSLLGIINDILDFSKIEAGKLSMEVIDFDLKQVISNLSDMFSEKAQEKGLELIFNIHPNTPTRLKGDALRLGQILINLINNALKFTEKGEVVISIEPLETLDQQTLLRFSVRDTGIGLTQEQQDNLFQSFQQADTSTTRKYGGTGLGLSISKQLTEMMGGEIGVTSEIDVGSNFFFTIKLELHDCCDAQKPTSPESLMGLRVMVVDDNLTFLDVMRCYLEDFGFIVETVSSGKEALKLFREDIQRCDLLLLDWQMPGMNGFETWQSIRELVGSSSLPKLILATGFDEDLILTQGDDISLDGYISKPVTQSNLFDVIMNTFGFASDYATSCKRGVDCLPDGFDEVRGAHILLVEDNEVNQEVTSELLSGEGFYIDIAHNGQEAIDMLEQTGVYDVVLMDLQMPIMDGYTATQIIREDRRFDALPIIAMTADAMSGVKEKTADLGMNDFVAKPIEPSLLFAALMQWITPADRVLPSEYIESQNDDGKNIDTLVLNLPGFDIENALLRMGGNLNAYKKTLKKFIESEQAVIDRITQYWEESDRESAIREAHTLKGVSGNIGATSLHLLSTELETALKEYDSELLPQDLMNSVHRELDKVVGNILNVIKESISSQSKGREDRVAIDKLLAKLAVQIDDFDSMASETCDELILHLKGSDTEIIVTQMGQALDNYDFDGAEKLLNQLQQGSIKGGES